MEHDQLAASTEQWYKDYYKSRGADRNDILHNHGALLQTIASEIATVRALRSAHIKPDAAILDVGCGTGSSLSHLVRLGFETTNMHGVDIQAPRIEQARAKLPNIDFQCVDATKLQFADNTFDLVLESTMFIQLRDDELAGNIAREMARVTKRGGYILLIDWRVASPWEKIYKAVTRSRIHRLFPGMKTVKYCRGAMLPPVGRAIAKYLPPLYFPVAALLPGLRSQFSVLLQNPA